MTEENSQGSQPNPVGSSSHRAIAFGVIIAAWVLAVIFGTIFAHIEHHSELDGIYWATATVTTVGYGDIVATTALGKIVAILCMLTAIPLWSGSFGLFFSWLIGNHISRSERRITRHVTQEHETTRNSS